MSIHSDIKPMIVTTPTLTDHALPTPPTSPSERPTDPHSVVLLNSLVQFYQHESLWVHRTRAALELALVAQGRGPNTPTPATSAGPTPPMTDSDDSVKAEPSSPTPLGKMHPHSRWMQRKKSFKLKLEGIPSSSMLRRRRHKRHAESAGANAAETGTRLLELFGQLMEARMESCHRVNRLVKDANRADLMSR